MTEPAEIVRSFYERMKAADAAGALALVVEDIEWITMWHYKVDRRGPERVAEGLFKPLTAEWSSFVFEPSEFIVDGDTVVSLGRNRTEFPCGRAGIEAFLVRKWHRELDYRVIKELWGFHGNRMAVRFAYEFHDDSGQWFRAYGNELWQFEASGLMELRFASINEHVIAEAERKFHWPAGRRPDSHPGLSNLGL